MHRAARRPRRRSSAASSRVWLSQRPAPARLGFRRRAARLPGVPRRPVPQRRRAAEVARADRRVPRIRRRDRQRANFPGNSTQQERHRRRRGLRAHRRRRRREQQLARRPFVSANARAGSRVLATDAAGRNAQLAFTGNSQLAVADFVWKWAPNGNAQDTNFKVQGEYFWRRERRRSDLRRDGALGADADSAATRSRQNGWYVQGVYQFMPNWRSVRATTGSIPAASTTARMPSILGDAVVQSAAHAVMLDWTPSEFSRFRVQFAQSKMRPDVTDNEIFVQYILTLGAHGAHKLLKANMKSNHEIIHAEAVAGSARLRSGSRLRARRSTSSPPCPSGARWSTSSAATRSRSTSPPTRCRTRITSRPSRA